MVESKREERRYGKSRYLVPDPSFGWYVRAVGVGAVVAAVVFTGFLWWYHGRLLDVLGLYEHVDQPVVRDAIIEYGKLSLIVTGASVLGAAVWMILLSVFFLHRIAGPIYRLKAHMMDMMAGDSRRELLFRDGDQMKDLSDIFNDFIRHFGLLEAGNANENAADEPIRAEAGSRF